MSDLEGKAFDKFMKPGGSGWFVTLVGCLEDISNSHCSLTSDELLANDLALDWPDLAVMSKAKRLRWIRCARIELDHWRVEEYVKEIIEAVENGECRVSIDVLLKAFPVDITLRRELTKEQRQAWCALAERAAKGRFTEADLEVERSKRIELVCGEVGRLTSGIYFVSSDQLFVKIGYAGDIVSRLRTLQTSVPQPLHVLCLIEGALLDERALHARFAADRVRGEWFRFSQAIRNFIEAEKAKQQE